MNSTQVWVWSIFLSRNFSSFPTCLIVIRGRVSWAIFLKSFLCLSRFFFFLWNPRLFRLSRSSKNQYSTCSNSPTSEIVLDQCWLTTFSGVYCQMWCFWYLFMFYTLEINYLCLFVGSVWVQPEQDGALPSISKFKKMCFEDFIVDFRCSNSHSKDRHCYGTYLFYSIHLCCCWAGAGWGTGFGLVSGNRKNRGWSVLHFVPVFLETVWNTTS